MGFGISFGANTSKTSQTEDINKTENTSQQTTGTTNQSTTGTTNTSQTGTNSSTGSQASTSGQTNQQSTQNTGTTTGTTTSYSQPVLDALSTLAQGLIGGAGGGAAATAQNQTLSQMGSFDPASYVQSIASAAQATANQNVDAATGTSDSNIGGTAGTNSMAALLDSRIRSDSQASVAGQVAQAQSTAAGIEQGNLQSETQAQSVNNSFLGQVLDALKGGVSSTSQASTGGTVTSGTTNTTANTNTAENSANTSNTSTLSNQDISTIIDQLLSGVTTDVGTSTTTGKTTKAGGGISL